MKKLLIFLLSVCLFICTPVKCYAAVEDKKVEAKSAVLVNMDTGKVLYEKNAHERRSPASVTKIMSILLTAEALNENKIKLTDKVPASKNAVAMGGSQIWLELGETMTVDELLKAVIVASANDACTALGEFIAGSDTGFVKMMNDRAKELGLKDTNFENCTGLDDSIKNHYSSAYDLAVIATEVMKYDIVTKYTTIWLDYLRNGKTELNNTNKLVNTYNGITGLKTGTTSAAGFCLCATANRDGMNLVAVILGASDSEKRFSSATYLLDYGFANYCVCIPVPENKKIKPIKVSYGRAKSIVPIIENGKKILCEKGRSDFTYTYNMKDKVNAPIKKGDILGVITVNDSQGKVGEVNIISPTNIDKLTFFDVLAEFLHNI